MSGSAKATAKPRRVYKPTPPAKRNQSIRGTYELYRKVQVEEIARQSDWRVVGVQLMPDLFRIAGSTSVAAVLSIVAMHTSGGVIGIRNGRIKAREGRSEFSCNLTTSDFHKLSGFSKRQLLKSVATAKKKGFIVARGKEGAATVQYKLNLERMQQAKSAADSPTEMGRRSAAVRALAAERALSADGADFEDFTERDVNDGTNEKGMRCRTGVPHLAVCVPSGGPVKLIATYGTEKDARKIFFKNELPIDADCEPIVTENGDITIIVHSTRAAAPPPPAEPQVDADALLVGLDKRKLHVRPNVAADLAKRLDPVPLEYFLQVLDNDIAKNRNKGRAFHVGLLKTAVQDAKNQYAAALKARERAGDGPPQVMAAGGGPDLESDFVRRMRRKQERQRGGGGGGRS